MSDVLDSRDDQERKCYSRSQLNKQRRDRQRQHHIITEMTQTHLANAFPTDGGTTPPNAVFLVDDELATLAARGEKANALAEVATSASRANFFMMIAMMLLCG